MLCSRSCAVRSTDYAQSLSFMSFVVNVPFGLFGQSSTLSSSAQDVSKWLQSKVDAFVSKNLPPGCDLQGLSYRISGLQQVYRV